eukprot:gnl/TRDRNA2_/TRDRNA2_75185_c0_seq1.p1 gnl/TRDRNA2_/TRDRNA2_75185_c0~~gnl/TRDRNA2_/TRDRNA2_75185_c0_seq1.p1  ORF type:complete len:424 (+),score=33.54 gnl/TRDRNA2_/TRDRNA2_75185_c0_seq1:34-1272(+)
MGGRGMSYERVIVDNDKSEGQDQEESATGTVQLDPGMHAIRIDYYRIVFKSTTARMRLPYLTFKYRGSDTGNEWMMVSRDERNVLMPTDDECGQQRWGWNSAGMGSHRDCNGLCFEDKLGVLGDGYCDDGFTDSLCYSQPCVVLDCPEWNADNDDCVVPRPPEETTTTTMFIMPAPAPGVGQAPGTGSESGLGLVPVPSPARPPGTPRPNVSSTRAPAAKKKKNRNIKVGSVDNLPRIDTRGGREKQDDPPWLIMTYVFMGVVFAGAFAFALSFNIIPMPTFSFGKKEEAPEDEEDAPPEPKHVEPPWYQAIQLFEFEKKLQEFTDKYADKSRFGKSRRKSQVSAMPALEFEDPAKGTLAIEDKPKPRSQKRSDQLTNGEPSSPLALTDGQPRSVTFLPGQLDPTHGDDDGR